MNDGRCIRDFGPTWPRRTRSKTAPAAPTLVVFAALLAVLLLEAAGAALSPVAAQQEGDASTGEERMPVYTTLGDQSRRITTDSRMAQTYFNQGLRLMYAYHTRMAVRAFEEAQRLDPDCAMCYWGEAWAWSPYLNGGMSPEAERTADEAIQRARALAQENGTEVERDLIDAFDVRYAADPDPDREASRSPRDRMTALDSAYSRAMAEVALSHPLDNDVQTLWAESIMLLRPRYEMRPMDDPDVQTARRVLEEVLRREITHPGACHLYIHLMEMSPEPEAAEPCADLLDDQIPGASHIQHMPSHIYMRTGRYDDAVLGNLDAWHVDEQADAGLGMIPIYPTHNLEMLVYAANWSGQGAIAIDAARNLAEILPQSAVLVPQTLALFGRWDEILATEERPEDALAQGGWSFARGMAFLRTDQPSRARQELETLERQEEEVGGQRVYRGAEYEEVLSIARTILEGEIALHAGRIDEAVRRFEEAVEVEDALAYSEPEPWHLPARRFLGAALLEAERWTEAE
ncbi:MAG: hypothetical protein ACLFWG_05220, partial [Longimicrobiales bacterium]